MSQPKKKPIFAVRPKKNVTAADVADGIARALIARVNRQRAEKGLPPLPKE